jgi:hypothetical protein
VSDEKQTPLWEASEAQSHFIQCRVYEVLYAGQRGSGKTDGLLMEPLVKFYGPAQKRFLETGRRSKAWVLFIRKELGRLKEIIDRAKELFPQIDPDSLSKPGCGWSAMEKMYRFTNGMKMEFGHLDDPTSHMVYHGRQWCRVVVDEAPEIPWYQIAYLKSCIRVKKDDGEPYLEENLGIRLSGNPYGTHVAEIKRRFIEGYQPNTIIREPVEMPDGSTEIMERVYIPSYLEDNAKHIDTKKYAASLADLPEQMKQAFLYGNWDYVPGAYFSDFDERIHVRENIEPPRGSALACGEDWGSANPACHHVYTTDGDGTIYILSELYKPGKDGPTWADEVIKHDALRGWDATQIAGYLDPGAFADPANGYPSPAQQMLDKGLVRWESDKSAGAIALACIELGRRLRMRTPSGIPGIIIDSRCVKLIDQIKKVQGGDPDKGENIDDIIEPRENHAFESCRAILLANPIPAEENTLAQEMTIWQRITRAHERKTVRGSWYPM